MTKSEKAYHLLTAFTDIDELKKGFAEIARSFPEPNPGFKKIKDLVIAKFDGHLEEALRTEAEAYAAELTEDQLDAAIAFYTSPQGLAFMAAQPKIQQRTAPAATIATNKLLKELMKEVFDLGLADDEMNNLGFFKLSTSDLFGGGIGSYGDFDNPSEQTTKTPNTPPEKQADPFDTFFKEYQIDEDETNKG